MKLYELAKITSGIIRVFDWKDKSKNIYDSYLDIPEELRNRTVCMISSYEEMVEFTLMWNK